MAWVEQWAGDKWLVSLKQKEEGRIQTGPQHPQTFLFRDSVSVWSLLIKKTSHCGTQNILGGMLATCVFLFTVSPARPDTP